MLQESIASIISESQKSFEKSGSLEAAVQKLSQSLDSRKANLVISKIAAHERVGGNDV